jgi:hypothetical protein
MGCAASRSSFSEDVVPNPFVTEPERGARRSEQCAAVILCMWSELSVAPLPLRCPSFYLPVLVGPLPPSTLLFWSPEWAGARRSATVEPPSPSASHLRLTQPFHPTSIASGKDGDHSGDLGFTGRFAGDEL